VELRVKLLLDTHAVIWFFLGDRKLSPRARDALAEERSPVYVSAVSGMEIATKYRLGKLPEAQQLATNFERMIREQRFQDLSITLAHATLAGSLEIPHKDPFDRLLIAQARIEQLALVSNEKAFDAFSVTRLW
jgi:PIN domain nuclease of toxin-antitoxin system